jgi:hypothetical protein
MIRELESASPFARPLGVEAGSAERRSTKYRLDARLIATMAPPRSSVQSPQQHRPAANSGPPHRLYAASRVDQRDTGALGTWRHVWPFQNAVSAVAGARARLQGCCRPLALERAQRWADSRLASRTNSWHRFPHNRLEMRGPNARSLESDDFDLPAVGIASLNPIFHQVSSRRLNWPPAN